MEKEKLDIHFLPRAADDLDEIITFMQVENYSTKDVFLRNLEASIDKLAFYPHLGHLSENRKIVKLNFRIIRFQKYSIYYKFENKEILICRILHNSRDHIKTLNN